MLEILCTNDYSVFKFHPQQRKLKPNLTARIMRSMKKIGFKPNFPVTVNNNFEIVDGQHRYQAARNLGLPIYYTVADDIDLDEVREMASAQQGWNMEDYVTSHMRQGNRDYIRLHELKERTKLAWGPFLYGAFSDFRDMSADIKSGKFTMSSIAEERIANFVEKFELFASAAPSLSASRSFVVAIASLLRHPLYNHEQMRDRLAYQSSKIVRCANSSQYVSIFNDIYNYRSLSKNVVNLTTTRGLSGWK